MEFKQSFRGSLFRDGCAFSGGVMAENQETSVASLGWSLSGRYTVVAIDNEPSALELIRAIFAGEQAFEIHTYSSAREGLFRAMELGVDLVLLDYSMPGLDGGTLLETLRRSPSFSVRKTPVIMVSGNPAPELAGPAPWSAYIRKPITDIPAFIQTVARVCVEGRSQPFEPVPADLPSLKLPELVADADEVTLDVVTVNVALAYLEKVRHDLRSQLNVITGYAQLLELDPAALPNALPMILKKSNELLEGIEALTNQMARVLRSGDRL